MTVNQSIIEENAMVICGGKSLKFLAGLPLTSGLHDPRGCTLCRIGKAADLHCFNRIPPNRFYSIPVKRLRIIA
ncbi:hypothetical protein [Burkholderia pyrrocinia]|uniref:hypothetical protein n=1 Tax=Burkholderia pyrrocinia TaxID=60550 RepID=UPI00191C4AA6|nr:hypothetical protein [Burkholderia pyrrocinia]